jgi:hypothetical protein
VLEPERPGDLDRLAVLARADGHVPYLDGNEVTVPVDEGDARAVAAALNRAALAGGIVLTELHLRRPSLESQYLAAVNGNE